MACDPSTTGVPDGPYFPADPNDHCYRSAAAIIAREHLYIAKLRKRPGQTDDVEKIKGELVGLALSGGGVRSASFCLGVMQALARRGWMKRLDYLSTVSGGGYIGTCLSWLLSQKKGGKPVFGLEPGNFPFGTRRPTGAQGFAEAHDTDTPANSAGMSKVMYWLRQHANFLVPGHGINLATLVGAFLGDVVVSLAVYFPLVCVAYYLLMIGAGKVFPESCLGTATHVAQPGLGMLKLGLAVLALMVALSVLYAVGSFFFRGNRRLAVKCSGLAHWLRTWWARTMGFLLMLAIFVLLAASVPYLAELLGHQLHDWLGDEESVGAVAGVLSALLGMMPARGAYLSKGSGARSSWLVQPVVTWVGAMLLLYGLVLLANATVMVATGGAPLGGELASWFWVVLVGGLLIGVTADLSSVSMHRYYRDRLLGTFMPQLTGRESLDAGRGKADAARLHEMCDEKSPYAPLHLINTNVVLVNASESDNKGRGGDSFVLTPLHCGSSATGWRATSEFMGGSVTLASAMAASGAAANPDAGGAGHGPTRDRALSFVLRMLNVRLGYWVQNPCPTSWLPSRPKFLWPGIPALFGYGFNERSRYIELTDGGHYENLGIYELVRRRCRLIIAVDAGADPEFQFDDLSNVIERVRADFGVKIAIDSEDLRPLLPGSAHAGEPTGAGRPACAERGWLYADVLYPEPEAPGRLIYLTTTFTQGLPADLYGYKLAHPKFPDEPTLNQFFDEQQFEAYRELGYQIADDMLHSPRAVRECGVDGALDALGLSAAH